MWIITKQYGDDTDVVGIRSQDYSFEEWPTLWIFRLLDGDGEIYYEGNCDEESFAPLDDFGVPYSGCTEIQYWQPDKEVWETL